MRSRQLADNDPIMADDPTSLSDDAFTAQAFVVLEQGEWVVMLDVFFWDEVVRHRIRSYPTQRQAELAAHWIERSARREVPDLQTGF